MNFYQAITVDIQDELYEFTWRAPDSDDVISGDECTALNIQNAPITFFLDVSANGCTDTITFNINLTDTVPNAKVFRFANTDVLFCNRNDFDNYQWGREHRDTLCPEPDLGGIGIFQDYVVPGVYDALGRMIHHQDAFKGYDIQTYYVAVPNLTQGIYFVRVTGNDGILLTEKIIVK